MGVETIINEIRDNMPNNKKLNNYVVYKSFQIKILDGFLGTVINQNKETNEYEVFSYLKAKHDIASPISLK